MAKVLAVRRLLLLIGMFLLLGSPARGQSVDPTGYFAPDGRAYDASQDVDHLVLDATKPELTGILFVHFGAEMVRFEMEHPVLDGSILKFSTKSVVGVHYSFEGAFTVTGSLSKTQPSGVVLKGTLTRGRTGHPNDSAPISFTYTVGD